MGAPTTLAPYFVVGVYPLPAPTIVPTVFGDVRVWPAGNTVTFLR